MKSVLIVDDEINICKLIKNEIDWDRLDLTLCDMTSSSAEVLQLICDKHPDIVITDIQMPGLNGLDLIREALSLGCQCRFIIVSGYSYFEYAQQAVKYGVENFLLKPIEHDELNDALEQICIKLKDESIIAKSLSQAKSDAIALRSYFLLNSAATRQKAHSLEDVNQLFHYHFSEGYFFAGVIRLYHTDLIYQKKITTGRLKRCLQRNIQDYCADYELTELDNRSYAALFNFHEKNQAPLLRSLQYAIMECNDDSLVGQNAALTMGVSAAFTDIQLLDSALSQAARTCNCRLIYGNTALLHYNQLPNKEVDFTPLLQAFIERLDDACARLDQEALIKGTTSLLKKVYPLLRENPFAVSSFSQQLSDIISDKLSPDPPVSVIATEGDFSDFSEFQEAVTAHISSMFEVFMQNYVYGERKAVHVIKEYIEQNYAEKLDLELLSDLVFLAPAYLGQLFKRETGSNITDFILHVRMLKAKELLLDIHYSIGEIAGLVGYKDVKYFTRLFKKNVGITPIEYRKIRKIQ